jgi:hypothetical protein
MDEEAAADEVLRVVELEEEQPARLQGPEGPLASGLPEVDLSSTPDRLRRKRNQSLSVTPIQSFMESP